MKKLLKIMLAICIIFCIAFTTLPAIADTVIGVVTMSNEIVTDEGIFYIVAQDEKGAELSEFTGELVKATGVINDDDGTKTIKLSKFFIISDAEETSSEDKEKTSDGENQ